MLILSAFGPDIHGNSRGHHLTRADCHAELSRLIWLEYLRDTLSIPLPNTSLGCRWVRHLTKPSGLFAMARLGQISSS
jgi:hypothetical protein